MQTKSIDIILVSSVMSVFFLLLLAFLAAILFLYQKRSIEYFKNLEGIKLVYEKNLLQSQIEIQEQTFQDISREIHDNIGLSLTLAKLQLNTMIGTTQVVNSDIKATVALISKTIIDLSYLSKSLNSDAIKANGLYNTLKIETSKIQRAGIDKIDFVVRGNVRFLDASKELILYRIAQETLNNALRHAGASKIQVTLDYGDKNLELSIEDNGIGFDTQALELKVLPTGIGNMRKRAEVLNGIFTIHSQPGNGTIVSITVPINQ